MTDTNSETLAELRGFFLAFGWVNAKTNHGYSFSIATALKSIDLDSDIANHFSTLHTLKITRVKAGDWRDLLFTTLVRWLLAYLNDVPRQLTDKSKNFSLSLREFYGDMPDPIIQRIESLSPIQNGYSIGLETRQFYACDYSDIVLDCRDLLVFLHFDVCD